jgi:methanethiol S-methyltransferase
VGIIVAVYGAFCYVAFLGSFLYSIGFVGDLLVPRTIDSGLSAPLPEALAIDLMLLGLFAVQHSVMARPGFKRVWTRIVPHSVERSTYVLFSSALLALLCWYWRPIPGVVWDISTPWLSAVTRGLFALGWAIVLFSSFLISHFELFGLRQAYVRMRGLDYTPVSFTQRALYKVVRHPLMLGFVIAFWATPFMSVGHLVFAIATSGYILLGISLEERDLMKCHGADYAAYRARVPMLFPTGVKHD